MTPKGTPVTRTRDGFSVRLRCGKRDGKPQILRLRIALDDEQAALERAERMAELSRALVAAGQAAEAPNILRVAGEHRDAASFERTAAMVAKMVAKLRDPKSASAPKVPTLRKFGEAWTCGELHEKWPDQIPLKDTAKDDAGRLSRYVYPLIGDKPLDELTVDDCEEVMRRLPESAARSRRHIAGTLSRLLRLAVYPCRWIERTPLPPGFLPKVAPRKAFSWLYPAEDAKLLAEPQVPYGYRLLWGFLAREGMREGEAFALTWDCLDLEHGMVRLDENKTDDPRSWALDAGVARALRLHREHFAPTAKGTDRVFIQRSKWGIAETLRQHLKRAGVKRPELFTSTATRQAFRVHDLRGTFVTISLANGKTERWVMARTGHTTSAMVSRYHRTASSFAELGLGELRPLDAAIPELAALQTPEGDPEVIQTLPNYSERLATPTGLEPVLPA